MPTVWLLHYVRRAVDLKLILLARALIPTAKQEAGIVHVVVEVVMGKEQVVDVRRPESCLDELMSRGRATVYHYLLSTSLDDERRAKSGSGRCRRACAQNVYTGHNDKKPPEGCAKCNRLAAGDASTHMVNEG